MNLWDIDEASAYFNIGEKKLRKIVADNLDTGFIIQNGVKFLIKRKQFEDFLGALTAIWNFWFQDRYCAAWNGCF